MKAKKAIGISFVSLLVLSSAYLGFAGSLYGPLKQEASPSYASWMSELEDTSAIRDMAIPGTHNTMALYALAGFTGHCQTLSLKDQLGIGVRFLDIRLQLDHDELKAVHNFIDQRATFGDIVSTVDAFLEEHPKEFVFVSIKEENKAKDSTLSFQEALEKRLSEKWDKRTTVPSLLGEVRGKAVILSRFHSNNLGIPADEGWQDSTSFTLPSDIYVQDKYATDIESKKEAISTCFAETGHALKINFLSGYVPSAFPPSYAPSMASTINSWVDRNLDAYEDKGIVLYDFVDSASMKSFFGGKTK